MTNEPMNPEEPIDPTTEDPEPISDIADSATDSFAGQEPGENDSLADSILEDVATESVVADDQAQNFGPFSSAPEEPFVSDTDEPFAYNPPPPPDSHSSTGSPRLTGLVRDPFSSLGGIASGIAHRYNWDVTLVRLVFVLALFASFGSALFFYLIAWVVIPRATVWPPTVVRNPAGGFSNRDIGIGLAVLGALTFTAVSGGTAGAVFVPLALVGGGVWLLSQAPRESDYLATVPAPPAPGPTGSFSSGSFPTGSFAQPAGASFVTPPPPVSYAVPPRSGRRKWFGRILLTIMGLIMLMFIAGAALFAATGNFSDNGFQISVNNMEVGFERHSPNSLAELDRIIQLDNGAIEIDLRDIPRSEWALLTTAINLDVSVDNGEVKLYVPEHLNFSLDAIVTDGSIVQTTEGSLLDVSRGTVNINPGNAAELTLEDDISDIAITVRIGDGTLEVVRVP